MELTQATAQAIENLRSSPFVQVIVRKPDGTFIVMSSYDYALSVFQSYYKAFYHDGSEVEGSQVYTTTYVVQMKPVVTLDNTQGI